MNKIKLILISLLLLFPVLIITFFAATKVGAAGGVFNSGNILTATNNTKQTPDWTDPLTNVDPGNVVQFRVDILNNGTGPATATNVKASQPSGTGSSLTPSVTISASDASSVSDTVTVSGPTNFRFDGLVANDTILFSPGCPSGCLLPDTILTTGVDLGSVDTVAASNNVGVTFKLYTVPVAAASPSPSPSASPSVAPSPSPSAAPEQGGVVSCPAGTTQTVSGNTIICIQNQQQQTQTVTQNNNQNVNVTQAAAAAQPAVAGVVAGAKITSLPKTGLPLTALLGLGGLPLGLALRKFSKGPASENTPESIWDDRQTKLDVS